MVPSSHLTIVLLTKDGKRVSNRRGVESVLSQEPAHILFPFDPIVMQVDPSLQVRPQRLQIDWTCFGGYDSGSTQTWNVCIRTDRHGQSIYGPSVAAVESMEF